MKKELNDRLQLVKGRINKSLQSRKHCHCPIIAADERRKPYLVGTGVVLELNSKIFIATAAHVFDESKITTIYTFLDGKPQIIEGDIRLTVAPGNDRNKDIIDIAIFKADDTFFPKLRNSYKPVILEEIEVNDIPKPKKYYAFIGYPATKTKPKYGTTTLKSEVFSYCNTVAPPDVYDQLSLSTNFHIVVGFNPKECLDEKGSIKAFPKAKGMSGGGVWLLEDLNKHSSQSHVNKLVGIGIEYRNKPKVMFGTRIGAVVEAIKIGFKGFDNLPETNFRLNTV